MNRRSFFQQLVTFGLASALAHVAETFAMPKQSKMKNWIWAPVNEERSIEQWKKSLAIARSSGIQALLLEIYDGRHAYFASQRLPVKADLLSKILPLARAEQIEVHAWMWSMPCSVPEILAKHPDWYNVNALGDSAATKPAYVEYYKFLDPGRPEVREWVQGTVRELAAIPELTGVHLDYIRHPDAILPKGLWKKYGIVQDRVYPQYDYGYTPYERDRFEKQFGADPIRVGRNELHDPVVDQNWHKFQLDMVVDLVNDYLVPAAHSAGKTITAAVFPGPSLARQMVRQDWQRFQVDAFLPMLYNSFYETGPAWVGEMTGEAVHAVAKPIYSGLFIQDMKPRILIDTAQIAQTSGASGISLFSIDSMNSARWEALRKISSPAPS
jgi:uncharacterized lipoprotein YddW (UPF0748 family)